MYIGIVLHDIPHNFSRGFVPLWFTNITVSGILLPLSEGLFSPGDRGRFALALVQVSFKSLGEDIVIIFIMFQ